MIICYQSLKGGVGKSACTKLTANCMAARGHRVLVVDLDPNNSTTVYYMMGTDDSRDLIEEKNVFEAINHGTYEGFTIPSRFKNIDILASHLKLFNLRGIGYNELKKALKDVTKDYDFVIIDTAPTYGNIEINALKAADVIFTPVEFDNNNFNTSKFFESKLYDDIPEKIDSWYILYARWKKSMANFDNSIQMQFVRLFEENFSNIADIHIPDTPTIKNYELLDEKVSLYSKAVGLKALAIEFNKLVTMITGQDNPAERF